MGCCSSLISNARIDEDDGLLFKQKLNFQKEGKLLLLGADGSGKQTFIKQLHKIFGGVCMDEEKKVFLKMASGIIYEAMQFMIKSMVSLQISYGDPILCQEHAELVCSVDNTAFVAFEEPYLTAVKVLWRDTGIQHCYALHRGSPLLDSAAYVLNHLDFIAAKDYICIPTDFLRVRGSTYPTQGIVEHSFDVPRGRMRIVDAHEMSMERTKWFPYFENFNIIFFVDLSQYDNPSRMEESKAMLKTIAMSKYFMDSDIVLILNKYDIFQEKILFSDLVDHFPDYVGPKKDATAAKQFIVEMFEHYIHDLRPMCYELYTYSCCATENNS